MYIYGGTEERATVVDLRHSAEVANRNTETHGFCQKLALMFAYKRQR